MSSCLTPPTKSSANKGGIIFVLAWAASKISSPPCFKMNIREIEDE
jgi:hypothetical protein